MKILQDSSPTNNALNDFLKSYGIWIAVALASIAFITVIVLFIIAKVKDKKGLVVEQVHAEPSERSLGILEALGGKENIVSSEAFGSRLVVVLTDKALMNKDALKELGVTNFIEMSNKITLLLEDKAELVKAELDKKD